MASQDLFERSLTVAEAMRSWFRRNAYQGIDPYLLDQEASRWVPVWPVIRRALKPFHGFVPRRIFGRFKPMYLPKALGLIISGNCSLYRISKCETYISEALRLFRFLMDLCSRTESVPCWGWPFEWGKAPRYPKDTPLVCVTSPIVHALLDLYTDTGHEEIRKVVESSACFLMREDGRYETETLVCFYYSPLDHICAYSGNLLAASALARLAEFTGSELQMSLARKALNFVLEHQNSNGSWHYAWHPDGDIDFGIDNRHTGYILESLTVLDSRIDTSGRLREALARGSTFWLNHLIAYDVLPKCSPSQVYPIDIHDVAQAVITAIRVRDLSLAERILEFTLNNMFDGKEAFYYKYFKGGRTNRTVFFRWGQAWMYRALTTYVEAIASHPSYSQSKFTCLF